MSRKLIRQATADRFDLVKEIGLKMPDVKVAIRYDGSPVLKAAGVFMAGIATDESAEADSLVVRCDLDDRDLLLEDAPEVYYVTDFYERHPVVLGRMSLLDEEALRDLLSVSHSLAMEKSGRRRREKPPVTNG
jgi:hypothetical protein